MKRISSLQNPLIKQILLLRGKSRERKRTGLFTIEGQREIQLALKGSYIIDTFFFVPEICKEEKITNFLNEITTQRINLIEISREIYQKIAYRETTEGVLALVKSKQHALSELQFKRENPLILVAEAPEKPGNIGALLRTADAANLDAVIIANPKTDLYNPNIIRSSVGCLFTTPTATGSASEIIRFLVKNNIQIYCAALTASKPYYSVDFTKSAAIVVGTETTGLSDEWLEHSSHHIIIPMQGEIDSINVSVAAAIIIFEAKRQREFR